MRLTPYSLLILLVIVLASCSSNVSVPVPADAALVVHFDGKALQSKFSWEDFKKTDLFVDATKNETDSLTKKILENPANSGVDLNSDVFYFVRNRGRNAYFVVTGGIKDDDAFAAVLQKMSDGQKPEKKENLSVLNKKDNL